MANNVIQVKRTSVSGRAANTTTLTNAGEIGLNMTDGIMYSTNGSSVFAIGANNINVNITGNATIKGIVANGSIGSAGQFLTSNGSVVYWSTAAGGSVNLDSTYAWTNAHTFSGNVTVGRVIANGGSGTAGQFLTSNGTSTYWSTSSGGPAALSKSVTVEAPLAADKVVLFYTNTALTISQIRSVLVGNTTPSVTFSVIYDSDVSATGTQVVTGGITCTNTTLGLSTTSFNNATIASNSFVWLSVNAVSGNVGSIHVSLL